MPVIFQGRPGRVVAIPDGLASAGRFVSTNPALNFTESRSIITNIVISAQGNFQFLHTLGNDIYVYVFGDRIGQMTISGVSVQDCNTNGHGFEAVLAYYSDNRLAKKHDTIEIIVGRISIRGFLTGFQSQVVDPGNRLIGFSKQLLILPTGNN